MNEFCQGIHTSGGVITEKDGKHCTLRIRVPAGVLSVEKMRGLADVAEKYGQENVHLTTRQALEISHIHNSMLEEIEKDLALINAPIGSERDEVVNIVACPGTDRCKFANIDSISLAKKLDHKLFGKSMPVKMRISVSACPYACTSPVLNEVGITGVVTPLRTPGLCTGCGSCTEYCKEEAIKVRQGIAEVDHDVCIRCGVCIESCPFDLISASERGYLITVGGKRGRHPKIGRELVEVNTEDEVVDIVDRLVYYVYRRAWSGRLLCDQLDDIQFDEFKQEILSGV
ncbi:4Fe-4S binding protein [Methanoplanus endosymbiosus]|uniref:4Fe-4S binding protein n=1 Tax=Methanoplanus endosymbiosus TaxID=33865 RepID=A0A9E7PR62_9EURY|nr:4Fe-4S binding protein [Methanoplanus endosymbiosus]UUX93506.1 4Fe-4S binding protein [Methanoplanus endosymbiosus]